ncbi:MAG: ribonuclease H-like domain-containing protein [Chitinophagaceae bacterium]|nr:ribonuclease H-like domain-containing protein [Chitinophagaceae bacterium]
MIKPENLLLIDIETVPFCKNYTDLTDNLQRLWDKKSQVIEKENPDTAGTFANRAGIYADFGKIVCIGLGYFVKQPEQDNQGQSYTLNLKSLFSHEEKELLQLFGQVCNKFFKNPDKQFCGHNIREFDIPYICRRSFINQIALPTVLVDLQSKKPWENPMLDTLQFWKFGEYKNFTSIDLLSNVLGIESPKDDIDGGDVAEVYWQQNDLQRIVTYCNKDIVTIAQVLMRLHSLPLLSEAEINYID